MSKYYPLLTMASDLTFNAGGLAAAAQSGMGNVAAGGLFALLQSIAMGGSIPAIVYIIPGAVIGGIAGWLVGWIVDWLVDWFQ